MSRASQSLLRCLTTSSLAIALLLSLISCGSGKRPAAHSPIAVRPSIVGEIAVVDEAKRFVLIDLESNLYVPAPGTLLRAVNAAGRSARLKASPEQKRPFIAADIVDGDPAVGDEVMR